MLEPIMIIADKTFSIHAIDFPGGQKVRITNLKNGARIEEIVMSQGQAFSVAEKFSGWKKRQEGLNRGFVIIPRPLRARSAPRFATQRSRAPSLN